MEIGDKIRTLRKAKKLTQEQLAEYLHVSSQAVSKWETGATSPDVDTLPKLAVFFGVTMDELFDFDRRKLDEEIEALVEESVPLRKDPAKAEAFYREALKKYPNNEVLLNCLLMVIPNERSAEKIELGEKLLDCTRDDAIKIDVLRILAETCHGIGEQAMAEHYLARMPELYFLKNEVAAGILDGKARPEQIEGAENVCVRILMEMLAMRKQDADAGEREALDRFAASLTSFYGTRPEQRDWMEMLAGMWADGTMLD